MSRSTTTTSDPGINVLFAEVRSLLPELTRVYVHLHANPELSMRERQTSTFLAELLRKTGCEVLTGVGSTGVVGVMRNGPGPTVWLRADMDALPVAETTAVEYASRVVSTDQLGRPVPVMHACGHDLHMTCLIGAAQAFASQRASWHGTVVFVFQPGEETGRGAQAMADDPHFPALPRPDVILAQHVIAKPAGSLATRPGTILAAADNVQVTLYGRGGHAALPEAGIDPVVMAAAVVMRLQTIVAREVAPGDSAVVTVGSLHAGTKENVIASEARMDLSIRTFDERVRNTVLASVERIVRSEAAASGAAAAPRIERVGGFPVTHNDPEATRRVMEAFRRWMGPDAVDEMAPLAGSEDFGILGKVTGAPSVFWFIGAIDRATWAVAERSGRLGQDVPTTHSASFLPCLEPTMETGVKALLTAAFDRVSATTEPPRVATPALAAVRRYTE